MQKRLGEAYPAFLRCLGEAPVRGVRANLIKLSAAQLRALLPEAEEDVPWAEGGMYVRAEKLGHSPAHHAGLFYAQEPSAMCAAPLLGAQKGERILDLCAAPGGKTTQIAAMMQGEGVLVANEYVAERARVLSQNVERMGIGNCAVLHSDTASLARALPAYFDRVLVDAPCSGEGMFRKETRAAAEWSEENVARCISRQAAILEDAAALLAGGGTLVYSTCTFEAGENEEQIALFLRRHPEFTLEEQHLLLPHEVRGEGHFAARLKKREGERRDAPPFPLRRNVQAERACLEFMRDFFVRPPAGNMTVTEGGRVYLLPDALPALPARVLRAGVEAGTFDGKRFIPAHALVMHAKAEDVRRTFELGDSVTRFLRGETLPCTLPDGWCAVTWKGYPLSLGKAAGGTLKNHYPKGLREF